MLIAEQRGEYDTSRKKDALVVRDADTDVRAAIFLNEDNSCIAIAVDMPNKSGTLTYSVSFDLFVHLLRARLAA